MADLIAIASAALGLTLSDPVPLAGSDRSEVVRCRTSADGTVVVKAYPATTAGTESFAAEAAGLEFIAGTGAGPDLLAADPAHRVIVMSDLGAEPSLADLLLDASPSRARQALLDWAQACARLAVKTAGRRQHLADLGSPGGAAVLARGGDPPLRLPGGLPPEPPAPARHWLARRIWEVPARLPDLSIEPPARLADDLSEVESLLTPGPFDVFSPGDICPDNNLITAEGVKFIDFESAEFHSAFLDAAYLRMPFSTCWCVFRLPDELGQAAEARYRDLLGAVFPDLAADEIWQPGVRRAMAAWTLHAMTYLLDRCVVDDESMNPLATQAPTRRQLLRYRWRRLAAELDQAGELPGIAALMDALLAATQSWPVPGLPLYPAFR